MRNCSWIACIPTISFSSVYFIPREIEFGNERIEFHNKLAGVAQEIRSDF